MRKQTKTKKINNSKFGNICDETSLEIWNKMINVLNYIEQWLNNQQLIICLMH